MPPRNQGAGGGTSATNANQSSANMPASADGSIDINRLVRLPLRSYTARNCYSFLVNRIPWMTQVENSWRLTGETLLSFPPASFAENLRLELSGLPFSVVQEIFEIVKAKIISDSSIVDADNSE